MILFICFAFMCRPTHSDIVQNWDVLISEYGEMWNENGRKGITNLADCSPFLNFLSFKNGSCF